VQLAEVVAAVGLAADLGLGQPLEHMLRSCVVSVRLAEHLGAAPDERDATYWTSLFVSAGCTGTSWEFRQWFGDDIAFRAAVYRVGPGTIEMVRFLLQSAGSDREGLAKVRAKAGMLLGGMNEVEKDLLSHCAISALLAEKLRLGELVSTSLLQAFARWDGKGVPRGVAGEDVPLPVRIANLASVGEVRLREEGPDVARKALRRSSAKEHDPRIVEAWCEVAEEVLDGLDQQSTWDAVLAAAPRGRGALSNQELDDALELLADYADLKSPWFTGHSRAVADLAAAAARVSRLPEGEVVTLRRAALVHDLGRNGVPNTVWDKPGPLTDSEREQVRLHAYFTDRVLHRAGRLGVLGAVASAAHERADGSGYPRGIVSGTVPRLGLILEAADSYQAMREDRPHRSALPQAAATAELRRDARSGKLDASAVEAVLEASGVPPRRPSPAPGGLSAREVEVLLLAARGLTSKAIGHRLGITPKTVGNHIESIYAKIGVSSRVEAAMFAMQQGLVEQQ
jgi:HD-GYP domain-containing protein (c-di-GMP phosphodiesterase class II)